MAKNKDFWYYTLVENPKKILIFSTAYYPFVGGAEIAIKEITDRISDVQFDLITARFKRDLPKIQKIGNVNVFRLGIGIPILDKLILPFWGAFFALNLNNKNHYDFYWCIMATFASGAAYIANILKFWKPVPIILTLQEGDSEEHFKNRWLGLINLSWKLALKRTKILTVISSYLAERVRKFGYKGKTYIIPNGVDVEKFKIEILKEEKIKMREELGLEESDIALITTSRLVIKNGVGDVIKALVELPENIKFVILGEGELRKNLEELVKKLNVSGKVIFKGFVSHDYMPKYLKACDIFIRPSLSEGMGNSFIEAMAAGIPVIGTAVGGIVDFIKEGDTGYFCQPENPDSIAGAVEKIINDSQKNQIIKNAYNMVVQKYDWNLIAKNIEKVFENTK
ncbi:MAG: glycosyltransferase family 4 protein [Patescibacteria group bacterium]